MLDLEMYVGEMVCVVLARPLPFMAKTAHQFEPVMVQTGPSEPGKPPPTVPALTDMLQGRLEKQGANYAMTYANPANKATRVRVAIDPGIVHAVFTYSEISIATPVDVPPMQVQQGG